MKLEKNKYVLEKWVKGDYIFNSLRFVNRESKRYFFSDVQRRFIVIDKDFKYRFKKDFAIKFVKDDTNELGFRRSIGELDKTDGEMTYQVLNSPAEAQCQYSFDEVFGHDLRDLQNANDNPLRSMINLYDTVKKINPDFKMDYKIDIYKHIHNTFDIKLKKLFNVDEVYCLSLFEIQEHNKRTILSSSATLFQVIDEQTDKKFITNKENGLNGTIMFWLFENKLVYQLVDGKDTW